MSVRRPAAWRTFGARWQTAASSNGFSMACFNFARWDEVPQAKPIYLEDNLNLRGYNCAPQVFYTATHDDLWICQRWR